MKKLYVTVFASALVVLVVSACIIEFIVYRVHYNKNMEESEKMLKIAYDSINEVDENGEEKIASQTTVNNRILDNGANGEICDYKKEVLCENDIIGILKMRKIQVEAPIKDGTSQEVMKTSVGHFVESDYWDGNVAFASHNSGTYAHYFENIDNLSINDEIEYITKLGTKVYTVQSIDKIEDTDWSMVAKKDNQSENSQNTVTLITCIDGQPNYRLCVRGVEIYN